VQESRLQDRLCSAATAQAKAQAAAKTLQAALARQAQELADVAAQKKV